MKISISLKKSLKKCTKLAPTCILLEVGAWWIGDWCLYLGLEPELLLYLIDCKEDWSPRYELIKLI